MALYNLDSYQILILTAILVPSLVTIWVVFLQKDLTEKTLEFKKTLKSYEKQEAEKLLQEIQNTIKDEEEEAVKIIINYSEEWKIKSEAVSRLINKENEIYKIGKNIIYSLFIIFISGFYASAGPNELFLILDTTRIGTFQFFFVLEISLILYWFLKIFEFAHILNKVQSGDISDLEELINKVVIKIIKERERR
jgi:hypothetical protein